MNAYLLNRAIGSITSSSFHTAQTTRLVHHIEPAPGIQFSSRQKAELAESRSSESIVSYKQEEVFAHESGVNVLAIDRYEGRFMVSGGADPSIRLWDLESRGSQLEYTHRAITSGAKSSHEAAHTRAITSISIYPFDPVPSTVMTTSHDNTLKLSVIRPENISPVHTFDLNCTPYSHSFSSHPGSALLIAVGTSENPVRLLDLRSGLSIHGLPGHTSSILSVSWAPHQPHLLASASADNQVIIFDIRRGGHNSAIATLDMDDPAGVVPQSASSRHQTRRPLYRHGRAHNGAVTGVRWTSNGAYLVTSGKDARIRVWDASTGANTLAHFGSRVRNNVSSHLAERAPLLIPKGVMNPGREVLLWPNLNEQNDRGEILAFELREGTLIKRLRVPGLMGKRQEFRGRPSALSAAQINALAWRGNGASGEGLEMFSAHGDGKIRAWVSRVPEGEPDEAEEEEMTDRKRKRDVLDEVYRQFIDAGQPS